MDQSIRKRKTADDFDRPAQHDAVKEFQPTNYMPRAKGDEDGTAKPSSGSHSHTLA